MPDLATPPGVNIIDSGPPKPPPAPTREIRVSQMRPAAAPIETRQPATDPGIDKPVTGQADPPKPESARERMNKALRKKANMPDDDGQAPAAAPGDDQRPGSDDDAPLSDQDPASQDRPADKPGDKPADQTKKPGEKSRVSPWRLADQWKERATSLEKQLAELKSGAANLPEEAKKQFTTQLETLQKRNEELEREMVYVNYEKSADFQKNYEQPYLEAWNRAVEEIKDIQITDPDTGQARSLTSQDLVQLAQLPLDKARAMANALYGDAADDMMAFRKEIRELYKKRQGALEEAKKTGVEKFKQQAEMSKAQAAKLNEEVGKLWKEANDQAVTDPKAGKFFAPVEGDQEGNAALAKGFALVDKAFSENPRDPRLTPEQRAEIVRRHAAVRNRAAAFGRMRQMVSKAEARVAELEKELKQYKSSTPSTGGSGRPASTAPTESTGWNRVREGLEKLAKH